MTAVDFDEIAERISPEELGEALGAERTASGWRCPLPERHSNGDHSPSFSVFRDGDRTACRCHGCDLRGSPVTVSAEVWGIPLQQAAERLAHRIGLRTVSSDRRIVARYDYTSEGGDLLYQVVRFEGKRFRQRRPDGNGGWEWKLGNSRRVLYNLPAVLEAVESGKPIYLVEGERDADRLSDMGHVATTPPGGAGSWRDSYSETLAGAEVRIIADRDEPGREHARTVAEALDGVAATVEVLEPAVEEPGADVSDHLDAGYSLDALVPLDSGISGTVERGWEAPIPLGPEAPDDLSADVLPPPLREHVEAVADTMQTPIALPLGLGLAAVSAALTGKARVTVPRHDWREPLNLYLAVVLGPANRKSPVERRMIAPIREWEREQAQEVGPEQRTALDRKEALEKRLDRAKRAVAKAATDEEEGQALADLRETRMRLDELTVPTPSRLLTNDVTSEALARLMADQHGRAAIVSSEGDVLRIFAGKYSSGGDPTLDLIKKAHTGDPVRVDRVGREALHLPRPLLTVGLTLQPALLDSLANKDVLAGEGVLARFLWMAPPSPIGERLTGDDVPAPDEEAAEGYRRLLRRLLDAGPAREGDDGAWEPHALGLTPDARHVLNDLWADVEGMFVAGGKLARIEEWGGKLVGNVLRLAGLLHVVRRAGEGRDLFGAPIAPEPMRAAVQLGRSLIPHAEHVLAGELEIDPDLQLARYVLRRAHDASDPDLTVRDLWHLTKSKPEINRTDDLREVLETLEAHRLVRVVQQPSDGRGREPSPRVQLNPHARGNSTRNTKNSPSEGQTPISGISGMVNRGGRGGRDDSDDRYEAVEREALQAEEAQVDECHACFGFIAPWNRTCPECGAEQREAV